MLKTRVLPAMASALNSLSYKTLQSTTSAECDFNAEPTFERPLLDQSKQQIGLFKLHKPRAQQMDILQATYVLSTSNRFHRVMPCPIPGVAKQRTTSYERTTSLLRSNTISTCFFESSSTVVVAVNVGYGSIRSASTRRIYERGTIRST